MKAMAQLRMCPHCRAFVPSNERVCPYCETEMGPRAADRREPAGFVAERLPHARFTTTIILLVNFGLYAALTLATMRAGNADPWNIDGRTLFEFGAKYRTAIVLGQWWRLVTAGFLHGGLFHILMNSWVLFDLGGLVEQTYGASRMIVIYFLATVGGVLPEHVLVGGALGGRISWNLRADRRHDCAGTALSHAAWLCHPQFLHALGDLRAGAGPAARTAGG
jgi:hypothetical protein